MPQGCTDPERKTKCTDSTTQLLFCALFLLFKMHEEHPHLGRQECKTRLTDAGHVREGGEGRVGCRFGVPELVLSRNRPPSSLAPGRTPVSTRGTAEGRGPGRRLPPSGGQQGPGSRISPPRFALGRRPSAPPPRPRLPRLAGLPPTRPVAAAASPTTRGWARSAPPRQR